MSAYPNMYTKEVIKHFTNPHNMGKIENADGIGKVGNLVCLPTGSRIQTNPFLHPIETLKIGSKVLSHNGKYNKVSKIFRRNYSGKIINIKSRLGIVKLTPDHLVKSIKVPRGDKYLRIKNKQSLSSGWYHTIDLKRNDILLYPKSKIIKDVKKIKIDVPKYKYDFRSKKISNSIPINENFLRLAGYFIAEGDTNMKMCHVNLILSFGSHEEEYVNDVLYLFKKIFNLVPTVKTLKERNSTLITVNNVHITRFFNKLFGKGCANKQIPEFMLFLSPEKQKGLIKGLWRGDGFINTKIPRAGFSTISYNLAQQVKFLLIRQGIIPSLYVEKEKRVRGTIHKEAYRIHVGSWSVRKLAKILDEKIYEKELTHDSWSDKDYIYLPITSVTSEFYKGKVHNLEVENTHSYVTDSALLHNCGDVMWLYIKVKNNKIADIKFETFGCVAAIATSSMITELVKRKTLEEAVKVIKDDVLKGLGGLPPIKVHCSVLVIDALHEAIYDYLSKNSLPISDELEKEHERIVKELQNVEKHHKEYIALETDVHGK